MKIYSNKINHKNLKKLKFMSKLKKINRKNKIRNNHKMNSSLVKIIFQLDYLQHLFQFISNIGINIDKIILNNLFYYYKN